MGGEGGKKEEEETLMFDCRAEVGKGNRNGGVGSFSRLCVWVRMWERTRSQPRRDVIKR